MARKQVSHKERKVPCRTCLKEIPLSEAKSAEAVDYVAHFCGLDCYDEWMKKHDKAGSRGGAAKKR